MIEPNPLEFQRIATPIGHVLIAGDRRAVRLIHFDRESAPHPSWSEARQGPVRDAAAQLQEYFAGKRRAFDLPLSPGGTEFQQRVWKELQEIPYGRTTSYGEIARRIGEPTASRAVGAANGANPIPIVIPCHRVIGANGKLTGFGGGLDVKARLLELETGQVTIPA